MRLSLRGTWSRSPRSPADAARWLDELGGCIRTHSAPTACGEEAGRSADGRPSLAVLLHPAADPLTFVASPSGELAVEASTHAVGPGLHAWTCDLLHALDEDFRLGLCAAPNGGDSSGYFESRDMARLEAAMLSWLQATCRGVQDAAARGATRLLVALPAAEAFEHEALALTPSGPRDLAWVTRAAQGGEGLRDCAKDFFPWWAPGVDAPQELGRATCLAWTQVRWREPITEEEHAVLAETARLLDAAHVQDPTLAIPWREWAEILGHLHATGPVADAVRARAAAVGSETPLLGYRRGRVRIALPGGWSASVPGSCALDVREGGRAFVAFESRRTAWISTMDFRDASGRPVPAARILDDPRAGVEDGSAPLILEADGLLGRAVLAERDQEGRPAWVLEARSAAEGTLALLTAVVEEAADRPWALDLWHGLAPPTR